MNNYINYKYHLVYKIVCLKMNLLFLYFLHYFNVFLRNYKVLKLIVNYLPYHQLWLKDLFVFCWRNLNLVKINILLMIIIKIQNFLISLNEKNFQNQKIYNNSFLNYVILIFLFFSKNCFKILHEYNFIYDLFFWKNITFLIIFQEFILFIYN